MKAVDFSPLYRSTIGFDSFESLFENALTAETSAGYPPYNIESHDENRYAITLAAAGFEQRDLDINVEHGVLKVRGKKSSDEKRQYLHRGIANRAFECKFNLADYVEVTGARFVNGLLTIDLVKEIPEAMKPKSIPINQGQDIIEHNAEQKVVDRNSKSSKAA